MNYKIESIKTIFDFLSSSIKENKVYVKYDEFKEFCIAQNVPDANYSFFIFYRYCELFLEKISNYKKTFKIPQQLRDSRGLIASLNLFMKVKFPNTSGGFRLCQQES